jgi:CheY-like chemotaxis protein
VDADSEALKFFYHASKDFGINCDTAHSGLDALSLVAKNGVYDVCFVNWDLPDMNGIEFARSIHHAGGKNAVILMCSLSDWNNVQEDAREAGVRHFFSKPLLAVTIAGFISEYTGLAILGEEDDGQAEAEIDFTGHSIMLAEDIEINREIVLALLEPIGLEIDCAENGAKAVELFSANPDKYDMIFMDLQMPEMDGYTATRTIRALDLEWAKKIPIVAMTANVFKEDVENCIKAGMNGHVGKPLDYNEVIAVLEKYFRK